MLHPSDTARGTRTLEFTGTVLLPGSEIVPGTAMVRLKDLFNVKIAWDGDRPSFTYGGDSLADARAAKARIIQWLPAQASVPCTLLTQDGEMKGACEPRVRGELGKVDPVRAGCVCPDRCGGCFGYTGVFHP